MNDLSRSKFHVYELIKNRFSLRLLAPCDISPSTSLHKQKDTQPNTIHSKIKYITLHILKVRSQMNFASNLETIFCPCTRQVMNPEQGLTS
jgi:hypothetical protein